MTILIAETNSVSNHYNGVDEDHILIRTAPIKPVKKILRRRGRASVEQPKNEDMISIFAVLANTRNVGMGESHLIGNYKTFDEAEKNDALKKAENEIQTIKIRVAEFEKYSQIAIGDNSVLSRDEFENLCNECGVEIISDNEIHHNVRNLDNMGYEQNAETNYAARIHLQARRLRDIAQNAPKKQTVDYTFSEIQCVKCGETAPHLFTTLPKSRCICDACC